MAATRLDGLISCQNTPPRCRPRWLPSRVASCDAWVLCWPGSRLLRSAAWVAAISAATPVPIFFCDMRFACGSARRTHARVFESGCSTQSSHPDEHSLILRYYTPSDHVHSLCADPPSEQRISLIHLKPPSERTSPSSPSSSTSAASTMVPPRTASLPMILACTSASLAAPSTPRPRSTLSAAPRSLCAPRSTSSIASVS